MDGIASHKLLGCWTTGPGDWSKNLDADLRFVTGSGRARIRSFAAAAIQMLEVMMYITCVEIVGSDWKCFLVSWRFNVIFINGPATRFKYSPGAGMCDVLPHRKFGH
jgi:hypothetical protein